MQEQYAGIVKHLAHHRILFQLRLQTSSHERTLGLIAFYGKIQYDSAE